MVDVRLILTMDCERVKESEFYPAGPPSWEDSARNIAAFAALAEEYGFRATFFAVPEAVEAHVALFNRLIAVGHEVGLHLHPHTFRYGINEYLGNLPYDHQLALLTEAGDAFEAAIGFRPTSFRAGHFSANADTFRVLSSLGFKRGSSTIPGRHLPGTGGDWRDSPRCSHYVDSVFEAPVTVDHMSRRRWAFHAAAHALWLGCHGFLLDAARASAAIGRRFRTAGEAGGTALVDLRTEDGTVGLITSIVDSELVRAELDGQPALLNSVTHSYVNYAGGGRRSHQYGISRRRHLASMLEHLMDRTDVRIESRTLTEAQQEFDVRGPQPVGAPARANSLRYSSRSC